MSAIQNFLDYLLHARLGKDVRQSIHDAIKQCYDDATGNPESVAAVVEQNDKMKELLENTPYTTVGSEGEFELPVHTINDNETSAWSTWSSEKIAAEMDGKFIVVEGLGATRLAIVNGTDEDIKEASKTFVIGDVSDLGDPNDLLVVFAGQDFQTIEEDSGSGYVQEDYSGRYQPVVKTQLLGMDKDTYVNSVYPKVSFSESNGKISMIVTVASSGVSFDLALSQNIKFKVVVMKVANKIAV